MFQAVSTGSYPGGALTKLGNRQGAAKSGASDRVVVLLLSLDALLLIGATWTSTMALVAFAAVLAASSAGAGIGLLFAIPRSGVAAARTSEEQAAGEKPAIRANTSLEEIADWLTKTIVGVGLLQWSPVLRQLDETGRQVGAAMFPADPAAWTPAGVSLILASALLGAISAYLWFYRHLPRVFTEAFNEADQARLRAAGLQQARADVAPDKPLGVRSARTAAPLGTEGVGDAAGAQAEALLAGSVVSRYALLRTRPQRLDDWCKGMFGGSTQVTNGFGRRVLSASILSAGSASSLIRLEIHADPSSPGGAVFFLHNTFPQPTPQVSFDDTGRAVLEISAWGAFTVGVLMDDGSTELELDLSTLSGASARWLRG